MVLFGLERNFTRVAVSAFNSPGQMPNEEGLQMVRMSFNLIIVRCLLLNDKLD